MVISQNHETPKQHNERHVIDAQYREIADDIKPAQTSDA